MTDRAREHVVESLPPIIRPSAMGIMRFNPAGSVQVVNRLAEQLLEPLLAGGRLLSAFSALAPLAPDLEARMADLKDDSSPVIYHKCSTFAARDGRTIVLSLTVTRLNLTTYVALIEDVTGLVDQERSAVDGQEPLGSIFENGREHAVCTVDLRGQVRGWNQSFARLGCWSPDQLAGKSLGAIVVGTDAAPVEDLLAEAGRVGVAEANTWFHGSDGSRHRMSTVVTAIPDRAGQTGAFVVVTRDSSRQKRIEDDLRKLATTDPLTGAHNRRWGMARIAEALRDRRRGGGATSVLMLDLDHFKAVNDTFGHATGDAVLITFVDLCGRMLRSDDVLVRWGGEEFLALLPGTTKEAAVKVAERIRAAVAKAGALTLDGSRIGITVSIGVAEAEGTDVDELIRRADTALYRAKRGGRDCVVAAKPSEPGSA